MVSFHSLVPILDYIGKAHRKVAVPPLLRHVHPKTLEIYYVETGMQVYQVGDQEFELRSGDFLVVYPNEAHGTGLHPEERADLYWTGLDLEDDETSYLGFDEDRDYIRERLRALPRTLKSTEPYGYLFERVLSLAGCYERGWHVRLHAYVADLLFAVLDLDRRIAQSQSPTNRIRDAVAYIDAHVAERITIGDLSERAGLSRSRFQTLFREQVGMAPGDYVLRQKVEVAKGMILGGEMTITEIAYDLSFSSSQHFSSTFHSHAGMTPSEYARSSHRDHVLPPVVIEPHRGTIRPSYLRPSTSSEGIR